jgi:hypothetical protein
MRGKILTFIAALIIPACAFGYWAFYEVNQDGLRERPWIIVVGGSTNESTIYFRVIFDRPNEHLSLDLRDEDDVCLSYTPLRGEAIQHAILQEVAIGWGLAPLWKKATPTVYEFSVNSRLLKNSKLSWHFEQPGSGLPLAGGVLEWCHLSTLALANRSAAKQLQPTPR